jgi:ribosomal protein S18 acetylase RimI-like enzyme
MTIKQVTSDDMEPAANLFAQYREFYQQSYDLAASAQFLKERIENKESIVFVAVDEGKYAGLVQLYPSFSSVGMKRIWILNDLFVSADHRQKGIAQALINHVIEYGRSTGRSKVVLSTAYSNTIAQRLYEKIGFAKEEFFIYEIVI